MYTDWLLYIDTKQQENLLHILQSLTQLQNKENINFIIVGALPLLIKGYLHYTVHWDIDLLFKDTDHLQAFMNLPKPEGLKIVDYDDELMVSKNITSFHTAWAFSRNWFNVDYIVRPGFFEFYTESVSQTVIAETRHFENKTYTINVRTAHPWNIIIEKVVSPRTARDIELGVDMSIDIRHIIAVYKKEKDNVEFWKHVLSTATRLVDSQTFKTKFRAIIDSAQCLGYQDIELSSSAANMLS